MKLVVLVRGGVIRRSFSMIKGSMSGRLEFY